MLPSTTPSPTPLRTFFGLVQQRVVDAQRSASATGCSGKGHSTLIYLAAVLTWVEARGVALKDIGPLELGCHLGKQEASAKGTVLRPPGLGPLEESVRKAIPDSSGC